MNFLSSPATSMLSPESNESKENGDKLKEFNEEIEAFLTTHEEVDGKIPEGSTGNSSFVVPPTTEALDNQIPSESAREKSPEPKLASSRRRSKVIPPLKQAAQKESLSIRGEVGDDTGEATSSKINTKPDEQPSDNMKQELKIVKDNTQIEEQDPESPKITTPATDEEREEKRVSREDRNAKSSADDDSTTTSSTSQTMLGMMFGSSLPNSDNANSPADGGTNQEQQTSYFSSFGFG